ncbi:hypothetical protein QJS10_CPA10g00120 [Acorus calamus]|uniref:Uncharacterized protein n=1 Tax=Acorus calamus TaxID=4465 RepID=A0AAV9DYR4_ACOCL|nr:hypothetical protein QJS10_CPA10g00120 [Acorus calamus]
MRRLDTYFEVVGNGKRQWMTTMTWWGFLDYGEFERMMKETRQRSKGGFWSFRAREGFQAHNARGGCAVHWID